MLGIELGEANPGLHLRCYRFEMRSHHFTGTTPGRPEVDNQRDLISAQVLFESVVRQFNRLANEQTLLALATFGLLIQPVLRNTINRFAMRTNDMF